MTPDELRESLEALTLQELEVLTWKYQWMEQARKEQVPPDDLQGWNFYGAKSGRGWGKTLAGSNWIGLNAASDPDSFNFVIAPTYDDVRYTCFEGPTGLYAVIPKSLIADSDKGMPSIRLWNGALIRGFSADTPERLRGPQCLAAGTLVAMSDGSQRPIEEVCAGDYVMTRRGARRVSWAGCTGRDVALWRLTGTSGIVFGTSDHPVYTKERGFVPLCQLQASESLFTRAELTSEISAASMFGASASGRGPWESESADTCTATSMKRSMGRLRKAWLFITRMRIVRTTRPRTLWRLIARHIRRFILASRNLRSLVLDMRRLFASAGLESSLSNQPASFATSDSPSRSWDDLGFSAPRFAPTNTVTSRVLSVESCLTRADVYDLTVEDAHEFFANGILVHNCHRAWCDEIASWRYPQKTWDNLIMGLRLGTRPRVFWTGTPKPTPFMRKLVKEPKSIVVSGSTYENRANLADLFFENVAKYEGTNIGRQELYGEVLDPEEAGIVKRSQWRLWPHAAKLPKFSMIILSLDTAFTEENFDEKEQTTDPTAASVWGVFEYEKQKHVMLLDSWEDRLGFPQLVDRVKAEIERTYGDEDEPLMRPDLPLVQRPKHTGRRPDLLLIEDKGSGISLRQSLANEDILTWPYNPGKEDKLTRLHIVTPVFAHRRVWTVESAKNPGNPRTWADPLITQVCTYVGPGSVEHDDLLDTCTQALRLIMDRFGMRFTPKLPPDPVKVAQKLAAEEKRKQQGNPYGN